MKIIHINCSDAGSTGKIISDISEYAFAEGHFSVLLCPTITTENNKVLEKYSVCFKNEQYINRRMGNVFGLQYGGAPHSTSCIKRHIEEILPDVVHIHSANCSMVNLYDLFSFLGKKGIPTIITNHAEFFYTGNCSHAKECEKWKFGCGKCPRLREATTSLFFDRTHEAWEKMKNAIHKIHDIRVVSVSPWVYERSSISPIMDSIPQLTIFNGINTSIFYPRTTRLKEQLGIKDSTKVILYVTAAFNPLEYKNKGGGYIVELAKRIEKEDAIVLVLGRSAKGAEDAIVGIDNLKYLGMVSNQNLLAEYYSIADVTVITSDRETFSMPVAESICCGTPVIGFKAGGPESIAYDKMSCFVDYGDISTLIHEVKDNWLDLKRKGAFSEYVTETKKMYSAENMARKYLDLYKEIVGFENRNSNIP